MRKTTSTILTSVVALLIIIPYWNWVQNPEMTHMQMTIKYVWYWVGAIMLSTISIYLRVDIE